MRSFPYLCKPQADEIFSSWFFRLAKGNSTDANRFAHHLIKNGSLFAQDCDLQLPERWTNILAEKLDIPGHVIRSSSLLSLVGNYIDEINLNGHNREILTGGTRGLNRTLAAQQFCPLCLQSDLQPYYRKSWRLTAVTICIKHLIVLSDRCGYCNSPINCHRLTWFHENSAFCFRCGRSLRNQLQVDIDSQFPIFAFQRKLEEAIASGWFVLSDAKVVRTPIFLEGLRYLSRPWFSKRTASKMYGVFQSYTGFPFKTFQAESFWPLRVNCLPILARFKLYFVLAWLVDRWPENLIEFCRDNDLTLTAFYKTDSAPPYWLHEIFDNYLNKKNYWVGMEEIQSGVRYLYSRKYRISPGNVAEVVGLDRSIYLTRRRKIYLDRVSRLQNSNNDTLVKVFKWG